jgi:HEAT repeat protein
MSKSKNVRVAARALLLQLHRHHPQTYLDRVDKSETPELQAAGLSLLGNLQGPEVIAYLLKILRHPDRTLRLNATRALGGHSDNEEVIAALHQARQDPSADVRVWSIRVLSRWDDEETLLQLAAHSRDPSPSVRLAILPALEKAHHPETLQTIAALASDPSEEVRTRALAALIEQGERTAIDLFLQELNRYPHHVQEQIQAHLEQSQQLARIAQRAQLDLEPNRRWGALVVLAALAPHQHISIFIEALKDPAPEVRREATRLLLPLLHTSDPQYAGVFDRLQRDPDHEIQSILRHHQTTLY